MKELTSCKKAITDCLSTQTFAIAHLYQEEKVMDMHIHDCYELYYSISGGKQFLIDHRFYDIQPGDLFLINDFESHYLSQIDQMVHERLVISVHPAFLKLISTEETDLSACFTNRFEDFSHKLSLTSDQQKRFLYYVNKMTTAEDYGHDIVERTAFMELLVLLNQLYLNDKKTLPLEDVFQYKFSQQVSEILTYINLNILEPISIEMLAEHFFMSPSYICRIFKASTGTTISKYITARRISIAKSLLATGGNVNDVCEKCGFNDYSNFLKAFTKAVGISPKKYAQYSGV